MPRAFYGLMGYLGEHVVRQWLETRYRAPQNTIVEQVMPVEMDLLRGGGYLDFGIASGGEIRYVYEVKCQDYIMDRSFRLNPALEYLWTKDGGPLTFVTQSGQQYLSSDFQKARIVALVGPNQDFIDRYGIERCADIILFSEILQELELDLDRITESLRKDLHAALKVVREPTQGKSVNRRFLEQRQRCSSTDSS